MKRLLFILIIERGIGYVVRQVRSSTKAMIACFPIVFTFCLAKSHCPFGEREQRFFVLGQLVFLNNSLYRSYKRFIMYSFIESVIPFNRTLSIRTFIGCVQQSFFLRHGQFQAFEKAKALRQVLKRIP